jgi:hypothetical protein
MPTIKTNGQRISISDADLASGIENGSIFEKYPGAKIRIIQKDGTPGLIPLERKALDAYVGAGGEGARFDSDEETAEGSRRERYGQGLGSELKAGGLALARGATAGLSDYALAGAHELAPGIFPSREDIAGYQEMNPGISTAGEIVGAVAPALATGGTSAAATGAAKVAGGGLRAGLQTAAKMTPVGAASRAVAGLTKGADIGTRMAVRAIEGGVFGALSGADTAFLRGTDVVDEMASGAVLGGLVGGGFGGVEARLEKAAGKIRGAGRSPGAAAAAEDVARAKPSVSRDEAKKKVVEQVRGMDETELGGLGLTADEIERAKTAEKYSDLGEVIQGKLATEPAVEELRSGAGFFSRLYAGLVSNLSSMKEPEILQLLQSGAKGSAIRNVAERADEVLDGISRSVADVETGLSKVLRRVAEHSRELKPEAMKKLVTAEWNDDVVAGAWSSLSDIRHSLQDMVEVGRGEFGKLSGTRQLVDILDSRMREIQRVIESPDRHMADVFMAVDNAKRAIGRYTASLYKGGADAAYEMSGGGPGLNAQAQKTAELYEQWYYRLMGDLENADQWGEAAAGAQKSINRSWTGYLRSLKSRADVPLFRQWGEEVDPRTSAWEATFRSDQGRWRKLFDRTRGPEGDLDWERLMKVESSRHEVSLKHIKEYKLADAGLWGADAVTAEEIKRNIGPKLFKKGEKLADLDGITDPEELLQKIFDRHMKEIGAAKDVRKLGDLWKEAQRGSPGIIPDRLSKPGALVGAASSLDKIARKMGLQGGTDAAERAAEGILEASAAEARAGVETASNASRTLYRIIQKSKAFVGLSAVPVEWQVEKEHAAPRDDALREAILGPSRATDALRDHPLGAYQQGTDRILRQLLALAPKPKTQHLYDELRGKDPQIDERALRRWKKDAVRIATTPDAIVDLMQQNALQKAHVDAFRAFYPSTYEGLAQQYRVWLSEGDAELSRAKLRQLSTFLGVPLTGGTSIRAAAGNQDLYAQAPAPPATTPAQGSGGRPLSAAKARALSRSIPQTHTERIEHG